MSPFSFTNILFDFIHLPVSHFSNAALLFRERFTRVSSVNALYHDEEHDIIFDFEYTNLGQV